MPSFVKTVMDIEAAPGAAGWRPMLSYDQKLISLMGFIICKLSKGSDILLDLFMNTGATEKDYLLDPRRFNFIECDKNSEFVVK